MRLVPDVGNAGSIVAVTHGRPSLPSGSGRTVHRRWRKPAKPTTEQSQGRPALANGKLPADLLARLLAALPPPPPELRLGPGVGGACLRHRDRGWDPGGGHRPDHLHRAGDRPARGDRQRQRRGGDRRGEPALLAAELWATALHDPTEAGLAAGMHELAHAAGVRLRVDRQAVLWFEAGIGVSRALGADPWATLASGSLSPPFHPTGPLRPFGSCVPGEIRQPSSAPPSLGRAWPIPDGIRSRGPSATRWRGCCQGHGLNGDRDAGQHRSGVAEVGDPATCGRRASRC